MRVKMKVSVSGSRDGQPWPPAGGTLDVADLEGADMCAAGLAEPVASDPVEVAVPPQEEQRSEPSDDDMRAHLEARGVKVDKRWGSERLRQEFAKLADETPNA